MNNLKTIIKKSFTLVELLLSVGIIIVAMVSFITFFPLAIKADREVTELIRVDNLTNYYINFLVNEFSQTSADWTALKAELYNMSSVPRGLIVYDELPPIADFGSENIFGVSSTPRRGAVQVRAANQNGLFEPPDFGVEIRTSFNTSAPSDLLLVTALRPLLPPNMIQLVFEVSWPISEPRYNRRDKKTFKRFISK